MVYGAVVMGGVATTSGDLVSLDCCACGTTRSVSAALVPLDITANVPTLSNAPAPIVAETNLNCFEFT
jgi:hypothetical protein